MIFIRAVQGFIGKKSVFAALFCAILMLGLIGCNNAENAASIAPNTPKMGQQRFIAHTNCLFCGIIARTQPGQIIEEDEDLVVIEKHPTIVRKPVDILIIPKKHIENIKFLNAADPYDQTIMSKMMFKAQALSKRLQSTGDFTVTINNGARSDQTQFHMHMHFRSPFNWR